MKHTWTIFLFITIISTASFAQTKVFMPVFEVTNVHPDNALSAAKLLKMYATMEGRFSLILAERNDSLPGNLAKKAADHGADTYLVGDMNRIGETVVIMLTLYDLKNNVVWKDMMKARTPDDLDPIMKRFAKVMGTSELADKAGDIYSVTDYNAKQLRRKQSNINFGLTVGGGMSWVGTAIDKKTLSGFGMLLSYDMRNLIFETNGEVFFGDQTTGFFSLDILKPVSNDQNVFFYGGGLGISFTNLKENNQWYHSQPGLLLTPQIGYIFNRDGAVNMRLTVKPLVPLYKVHGTSPFGIVATLSILF